MSDAPSQVRINRAPVLTLWASIVAERLGYDRDEALTLGRGVAGLNAFSKGQALGIYSPREKGKVEKTKPGPVAEDRVELLHRLVPVVETRSGMRALDKGKPADPAGVERYLASKFKDDLGRVRQAMEELAGSIDKRTLAAQAYELYERFRPAIPSGRRGWGAAGVLDLNTILRLARRKAD